METDVKIIAGARRRIESEIDDPDVRRRLHRGLNRLYLEMIRGRDPFTDAMLRAYESLARRTRRHWERMVQSDPHLSVMSPQDAEYHFLRACEGAIYRDEHASLYRAAQEFVKHGTVPTPEESEIMVRLPWEYETS